MTRTENFTLFFYFDTLTRLIRDPRGFFGEMSPEMGLKRPSGFLLLSAAIFAGAGLGGNAYPDPALMGAIFFINAVGMTLIAAGLGYMTMVMCLGKRVGFIPFLAVYALSAGVTLLASWIPFFLVITEPWKWWLVGIGMTRAFGFTWKQALLVIGISLTALVLFFRSLLPVLFS